MGETILAIGTTRAPKVKAVRRSVAELRETFPDFLEGPLRFEPRSVPSGAPSMPKTTLEMITGARNRAERAIQSLAAEGDEPDFGIGLEGGVVFEDGAAFLTAWAYVSDRSRGYLGSSGCIPLPESLGEAVRAGEDLGAASDRFFGRVNVRSNEGTFGVLTGLLVTREDAFVRSMFHALAPFYNASAYRGPR